ncbi:hypothetical protein [Tsuneonella rigui]|uniref:hypothetical protein n=1 Tax=Tsuneonella rigui TaxID=1708790 RepID=UPI000F7F04BE|nr:hypothetical protein [Tsuneonella rigui]
MSPIRSRATAWTSFLIGLALISATSPGWTQTVESRVQTLPAIGQMSTAAPGEELYQYFRLSTTEGAVLQADTKAGDWLLERPVPKGTKLIPVSTSKAFKACGYTGAFEETGPCFIDDDGDGTFDRQAKDAFTIHRKIKVPVPYTREPISAATLDDFKHVILFAGATGDTLRFSYREFINDMARPAFTEELTVPRESFPQMIKLKGRTFEITNLTGMGLTYRLVS